MHILVTGATGLVGKKVCEELLRQDHQLTIVGRRDEKDFRSQFSLPCDYISWSQIEKYKMNNKKISRVDAVIHLAGESIAEGTWSKKKKKRIYDSRIETTQLLVTFLQENLLLPEVFISASAVGFYGESKAEESFIETDPFGSGFLAEVCRDWELASSPIAESVRLVHLRIGLVFDDQGGFLAKLEPVFNKGIGGKIGSGQQWMSWIHIEDLVGSILFCLNSQNIRGPVNAVAPEPITNKEWTSIFARVLKVRAFFTVPEFVLKAGLGEKSILALQSQKVIPKKLISLGFQFKYKTVSEALDHLYAWKKKLTDKLFYEKVWLSHSLASVFEFFSDEKNLEVITPQQLNFKVLGMSTDKIQKGTVIDYKLKIHGVPVHWKTKITHWDPPNEFSDNQEKGPYSLWDHTHKFEELAGGVLMSDIVKYRLPFGILGDFLASYFVKKDIRNIFNYRQKIIKTVLPSK